MAAPKCHTHTFKANKPCAFFALISPLCVVIFQREQWKQQRRRQQTEPAVPAGRRKVSHVQLGGRVFSTSESRPELSAFASGQHEPPGSLRVLHVRPGGPTAGAQHARTPAPTAGLLVGTSNLQSCGFGLLKEAARFYSILQKKRKKKRKAEKRRLISTCMK